MWREVVQRARHEAVAHTRFECNRVTGISTCKNMFAKLLFTAIAASVQMGTLKAQQKSSSCKRGKHHCNT